MNKIIAVALAASLIAPNAFAMDALAPKSGAAPVLPTPAISAVQAVSIQPKADVVPRIAQTALGSVQTAATAKPQSVETTARSVFDGAKFEAKAPTPAVLGALSAGAAALTPSVAHAAPTFSQHVAEPTTWVILGGAMIGGGLLSMTVNLVRSVARTLDDEPSEFELARYKRSERVLSLGRFRDGSGFGGDRIPLAGARQSFDLQIKELSGVDDANQAILEAGAYSREFRLRYPAAAHPWIAAVLRWRRGETDPEIKALQRRASELRRFQAMSGVYFKDAPLPADEFERAANELKAIEARLESLRGRR